MVRGDRLKERTGDLDRLARLEEAAPHRAEVVSARSHQRGAADDQLLAIGFGHRRRLLRGRIRAGHTRIDAAEEILRAREPGAGKRGSWSCESCAIRP